MGDKTAIAWHLGINEIHLPEGQFIFRKGKPDQLPSGHYFPAGYAFGNGKIN